MGLRTKTRLYNNIFTTNYRWLVVIDSNLNLSLRLLFCSNNNNLSLMIWCRNVVSIAFLKKKKSLYKINCLVKWVVLKFKNFKNIEKNAPILMKIPKQLGKKKKKKDSTQYEWSFFFFFKSSTKKVKLKTRATLNIWVGLGLCLSNLIFIGLGCGWL